MKLTHHYKTTCKNAYRLHNNIINMTYAIEYVSFFSVVKRRCVRPYDESSNLPIEKSKLTKLLINYFSKKKKSISLQ